MECKEQIKDYTKDAENYDSKRYIGKDAEFIDDIRRSRLKKLLNPNKGMKILDVGTGTGSGVIFFANNAKEMIGLDATQAMLDEAQKKADKLGIKNIKLVHGNALKLPFDDESFDSVMSLNFIHLFKPVENQKRLVKEMERVLKKGGSLVIEIDNYLHYRELGNNFKDIYRLSNSMKIEKIIGTTLTKTKKLFWVNKHLAKLYSSLAMISPFKYLAHRFIVRFRKE